MLGYGSHVQAVTREGMLVLQRRDGRASLAIDRWSHLILPAWLSRAAGQSGWEMMDKNLGPVPLDSCPRTAERISFYKTSRALTLTTPAGQQSFFRAAGWDLSQPKPEGWTIAPEAQQEAAAASGTTVIGPPQWLDDWDIGDCHSQPPTGAAAATTHPLPSPLKMTSSFDQKLSALPPLIAVGLRTSPL